MNRPRGALAGVFALTAVAVVVGVLVALGSAPRPETAAPGVAGTLGLLFGGAVLLVTVLRARGDPGPDAEPAPWTDDGRLVDRPPEETPDDVAVSGTSTAEALTGATRAARSRGDVEAGVEAVRPRLRRALGSALVAGGRDPDDVEGVLAAGSWTDDRLAAAVLDEAVEPSRRTMRGRLRDWLFPERAVRERTRRAVAAVDEAAGDALPVVVGEDAPRTVPVVAPTLEDLRRTADGRLQRAEAVGDGGRWRRTGESRDGDIAGRDTGGRVSDSGGVGGGTHAGEDGTGDGERSVADDWGDIGGGR